MNTVMAGDPRRPALAMSLGIAVVALGLRATSTAATITVLPNNLESWVIGATGSPLTASGGLESGPGSPPLGSGSASFRVGANGAGTVTFRHGGFAGTRLADLDELKYSTHVTAAASGALVVYILLQIDIDLNGSVDDLLHFEPEYQNGYTTNVPTQADVASGIWQQWDALVGGWWSSNGFAGAGPGAGVKSLAAYIAALPNARIVNSVGGAGGVRLVAGAGTGMWSGFVGSVDAFTIGTVTTETTVHDFEVNKFQLRTATVLGPAEAISVHLDVTSGRSDVASIGARLTYDPSTASFLSLEKGAGIPATWGFAYQNTAVAGEVDVVLTDTSPAAARIAGPLLNLAAVKVRLARLSIDCAPVAFDFNLNSPVGAAALNAFPANQYLHYLDTSTSSVILDRVGLGAGSGPAVDDHAFIRGNINNRGAHALDIGDVIDMASSLFGSLPQLNCAAAHDTNNDGQANITDLVTLVQGIFNSATIIIRPPSFLNPGVGIPGVVVPDGGLIPSILGCADGETCP